MDARLAARAYENRDERKAFRQGYSDGYEGRERDRDTEWVNAYSAGYNEGRGDKNEISARS